MKVHFKFRLKVVCLFVCFYFVRPVLLLLMHFCWFLHRDVLKCSASLDTASPNTGEDTFTKKRTFLAPKGRCCVFMITNS